MGSKRGAQPLERRAWSHFSRPECAQQLPCPRQESNLDLPLRRRVQASYGTPSNGRDLARLRGCLWLRSESRSGRIGLDLAWFGQQKWSAAQWRTSAQGSPEPADSDARLASCGCFTTSCWDSRRSLPGVTRVAERRRGALAACRLGSFPPAWAADGSSARETLRTQPTRSSRCGFGDRLGRGLRPIDTGHRDS